MSATLGILPQGEEFKYLTGKRLGGTQNRSGRDDEEEDHTPSPEIETRSFSPWPALYWLNYFGLE